MAEHAPEAAAAAAAAAAVAIDDKLQTSAMEDKRQTSIRAAPSELRRCELVDGDRAGSCSGGGERCSSEPNYSSDAHVADAETAGMHARILCAKEEMEAQLRWTTQRRTTQQAAAQHQLTGWLSTFWGLVGDELALNTNGGASGGAVVAAAPGAAGASTLLLSNSRSKTRAGGGIAMPSPRGSPRSVHSSLANGSSVNMTQDKVLAIWKVKKPSNAMS